MPALLVRNGLQRGRVFRLEGRGRSLLGRGTEAKILLPDVGISRRHAEFVWKDGGWVFRDLQSTNGSYLNALPVKEARIAPHDVILVGPIELLVTDDASGIDEREEPPRPMHADPTHRVTSGPAQRILGASKAVRDLIASIKALARTDTTLLIRGETGTGKELVAHAIHASSRRAHGPFVTVNCAAIPENLVESELFGHEAGAFTGATVRRLGHFETASRGTLLLDEIGDLPLASQAKLLRVLEARTIRRVGGSEEIRVDLRILAATHRDMEKAVSERAFRQDLYHRLKVAEVVVAPLRERASDIPLLAQQFVDRIAMEVRKPGLEVSPEALARLQRHAWPGNVRELRNALERAAIVAPGKVIAEEHLAFLGGGGEAPAEPAGEFQSLSAWEAAQAKAHILKALERAGGSKSRAAQLLGISRQNLYQRMQQYGLPA